MHLPARTTNKLKNKEFQLSSMTAEQIIECLFCHYRKKMKRYSSAISPFFFTHSYQIHFPNVKIKVMDNFSTSHSCKKKKSCLKGQKTGLQSFQKAWPDAHLYRLSAHQIPMSGRRWFVANSNSRMLSGVRRVVESTITCTPGLCVDTRSFTILTSDTVTPPTIKMIIRG